MQLIDQAEKYPNRTLHQLLRGAEDRVKCRYAVDKNQIITSSCAHCITAFLGCGTGVFRQYLGFNFRY